VIILDVGKEVQADFLESVKSWIVPVILDGFMEKLPEPFDQV
jgi:hypothetical protein